MNSYCRKEDHDTGRKVLVVVESEEFVRAADRTCEKDMTLLWTWIPVGRYRRYQSGLGQIGATGVQLNKKRPVFNNDCIL
jgi:hypothetical protein